MKFYTSIPRDENVSYPYCILTKKNWNDWGFLTTFSLQYRAEKEGNIYQLGSVKIGKKGMDKPFDYLNTIRTPLESDFEELDDKYFSVGGSSEYYKNFYNLSLTNTKAQENILDSLHDIVYDTNFYFDNKEEDVMKNSLMRSSSIKTIKDVYSRVLNTGDEHLTSYDFTLKLKNEINDKRMTFKVSPDELPQSNIHALIGRNGVGKTNFFTSIISTLTGSNVSGSNIVDEFIGKENISSVLALSYSVFDTTLPDKNIFSDIPYRFIGFNQESNISSEIELSEKRMVGEQNLQYKLSKFIVDEFMESMIYIRSQKFLSDLANSCIKTLDSDPIFQALNVNSWLSSTENENIRKTYSRLSSGHKIVLLSLFQIIINVEPNSIVLVDEPEQNLHPPLISSFIQAILNVLKKRNAMAIVATHSPVVVQECSEDSTWILNRSGHAISINRPTIKTFGANVGAITHDVFDLEVDKSGYMNVINQVIENSNTVEEVLDKFHNKLGDESRMRIASILYQREVDND
ncbi:AAA family ATPase [Lentilactobacillus kosonis]|uniref:EA59 gene protein n=1 Tax=Lentilactobacillus kosonis TaxID=2810561 RepID=A0A401FI77_9LACO|nr:AAA family ATPase [Lentilactobacillus kosonis]GAY71961.1 EA59 gene protein [Lentilactobacillus kosonis]